MCMCMAYIFCDMYVCMSCLCAHTYIYTYPYLSTNNPISNVSTWKKIAYEYIHMYIHRANIHTKSVQYHMFRHEIHTYIHTYIHTHIHTYIHRSLLIWAKTWCRS